MNWAKEIKLPLTISMLILVSGIMMLAWHWSASQLISIMGIVITTIGILLIIQFLVFFRDPLRSCEANGNTIIAPADGRVVAIEEIDENKYIQGPALRIAIFMHVGNVHIQRMPLEATFKWQKHYPGKYVPAFDKQAAKINEQRLFAFERNGKKIALFQIAGLLARRTICWLNQEDSLIKRNTKIGMITLGSEIDLYLPLNTPLQITIGDKVLAGQTIIGEWTHD